MSEVISLIYL